MLGPVLFLIFINDLGNGLSSEILKFADDTKLYRPVNSPLDSQALQHDLDTVNDWAKCWDCWQMGFNVSKCKVAHYGKGNIGYSYSMDDQSVEV